jgi:starch synthase
VHVEYLARELAKRVDVEVRCFGAEREGALAFRPSGELNGANPALETMSVDLAMAAQLDGASVVHSHTWYANFAGHVAKLLHGLPHVVTTHSLEPLRPWKADQLGPGGYALSSFRERTAVTNADAVVAVSSAMRDDVLRAHTPTWIPSACPVELGTDGSPVDPKRFASDFAQRVNMLLADPERAAELGRPGRKRAVEQFSWGAIADQTIELYRRVGA